MPVVILDHFDLIMFNDWKNKVFENISTLLDRSIFKNKLNKI